MIAQTPTPDPADSAPTDDARSGGDGPPLLDGAVMAQLVTLAGPGGADALLAQIAADLSQVRADLSAALGDRDRAALRRASHVLVSLSGTIGAVTTCGMARDLTGADNAACCDRLDRLATTLLADIDRLLAELAALDDGAAR